MMHLKILIATIILLLIISCGGTKDDGPDYTQMTDAELMALADDHLKNGEYKDAIKEYNRLLLDFPTSNLHIDAQLRIADAYGKMDKFEEQMAQLLRLVKENIIPERVPLIYVQIGKFYERAALFNPGIISSDSSDYKLAIKYYEMAQKYPDSDDAFSKSEALYRRAMTEAKIGLIDDAISRYRLVSSLYPNTNYSILAQLKLKNPENTSDLLMTDSAMTSYKQALGIIEAPQEDEVEEPEEVMQEEQTTIETTVDEIGDEEPEDGSIMEESAAEDEQQEDSGEETFTPAVEDSSGR